MQNRRQFTIRTMLLITLVVAFAMPFVATKLPEIARWFGYPKEETGLKIPAGHKFVTFRMRAPSSGSHGILAPGDVVDLVEIRDDNSSNNKIATKVTVFAVDWSQPRSKVSVILNKTQSQNLNSSKYPDDIMCRLNEEWIAEMNGRPE